MRALVNNHWPGLWLSSTMLWNRCQFNSEIIEFSRRNSQHWKLIELQRKEIISKTDKVPELYAKCSYKDLQLGIDFEFYIIYSPSYQVPVLYFLPFISKNDISSVAKLEDFYSLLSSDSTAISLSENPINGLMMYSIHPCLTSKFMEEIISSVQLGEYSSSFSAIGSWLSFCPIEPLKSLLNDPINPA